MTLHMRLQPAAIGSGLTSQRVRDRLVERLRAGTHEGGGIVDERVLNAIRTVPRHLFVDEALATRAYEDTALPIGHGQTISQPWVVAKMTEALLATDPAKVLEIGTGSGYQAAVLAEMGAQVYTIEIIEPLGTQAARVLRDYPGIQTRIGDGYRGWPEHAPFDAIMVTAAVTPIPPPLLAQLKPGGRMVIPVGAERGNQVLMLVEKDSAGRIRQERITAVRFVPLTGER